MSRTLFRGGAVVLPDRLAEASTLVVEDGRIVELVDPGGPEPSGDDVVDTSGCVLSPGFIDVHLHGVAGHDVLDGAGAVGRVAEILPRFGVTAFCPTSIAASAAALETLLTEVEALRVTEARRARVLGAHLESSFLNEGYRGAQPAEWLRTPAEGGDLVALMLRHRAAVAIVTLAPELPGILEIIARLVDAGIRVSLGHSAATFDQAERAFTAGASRVTHLYNRMSPLGHREPGLVGAALARPDVVVELIVDGEHVHPAIVRTVWAAKGAAHVAAITDGTAGSGMPRGSRTRLGGQPVTVDKVVQLEDGTMAGSVVTMADVFNRLVSEIGVPLVDAALMCATTPATDLRRPDLGRLTPGAHADFVIVDQHGTVRETWIGGTRIFTA